MNIFGTLYVPSRERVSKIICVYCGFHIVCSLRKQTGFLNAKQYVIFECVLTLTLKYTCVLKFILVKEEGISIT